MSREDLKQQPADWPDSSSQPGKKKKPHRVTKGVTRLNKARSNEAWQRKAVFNALVFAINADENALDNDRTLRRPSRQSMAG